MNSSINGVILFVTKDNNIYSCEQTDRNSFSIILENDITHLNLKSDRICEGEMHELAGNKRLIY